MITVPHADLDRVVDGWHHDPHSVLGPHSDGSTVTIRTLRPWAQRFWLALRLPAGRRWPLPPVALAASVSVWRIRSPLRR